MSLEAALLYSKSSLSIQYIHGLEFISDINLFNNMKVLDIGCGTGELSIEIYKQIYLDNKSSGYLLGIDLDNYRIDIANNYIKQNNYNPSSIEFKTLDITKDIKLLSNYKNKFDLIFLNHVIHWIPNKKQLFINLSTLLNENGIIAIQSPNTDIKILTKLSKHSSFNTKQISICSLNKILSIAYDCKLYPSVNLTNICYDSEIFYGYLKCCYLYKSKFNISSNDCINWMIASTHGQYKENDMNIDNWENIYENENNIEVFRLLLCKNGLIITPSE